MAPREQRTDVFRLKSLSVGVPAIVLTLLVLSLIPNVLQASNRNDQIDATIGVDAMALVLSLPWGALERHVAGRE